jgi:hypothetical protein
MRVALLVVIPALASLGWNWDARAEFNCFETPGEGSRCACIGANDCTEMKTPTTASQKPRAIRAS